MQARFLALGVHIVPVSGKGNLINALAVARGLEIPYFAIFDADMNLGTAENITLNKTILSVMAYAGIGEEGSFNEHLFEAGLCVWKECLQSAISENVADWEAEKANVCAEFGWTIDRLRKNPMAIEATLDRVYKRGRIAHFETLCSAIAKKFGVPVPGET